MMLKKGDTVFYTVRTKVVRAKVLVAHRDGSARVQAQFYVEDGGREPGPFLGYNYEMVGTALYPNAMSAENAIAAEQAAKSPWPTRPDGTNMTLGEMPHDQMMLRLRAGIHRTSQYFQRPEVQAGIAAVLNSNGKAS